MKIIYLTVILLLLAAFGLQIGGAGEMEKNMADKTTQKKPEKPKRDDFVVKGTEVLITQIGDRETLQINGRVEGFHHTESGYLLKRDVFRKPAKTLREAAERYLESEAAQ